MINPFWKLSLVFKCLTDSILLDDFKTELKRLGNHRLQRDEARRGTIALSVDEDDNHTYDDDKAQRRELEFSNDDREYSFQDALRTGPPSDTAARRPGIKQMIGKAGQRISPLPSLSPFKFSAIKAGPKGKRNSSEEPRSRNKGETSSRDSSTERVKQVRQSLGVLEQPDPDDGLYTHGLV